MIGKKVLILAALALAAVPLTAETLLNSNFGKDASLWYALPKFGSAAHDGARQGLRLKVNSAGEARIANWKSLTGAMCAGRRVRLTGRVSGTGVLTPVFVLTVPSAGGGKSYPRRAGNAVTLGAAAEVVEFILDLRDEVPLRIEPRFELKGADAEAVFEAIRCETLAPDAAAAAIEPESACIPVQAASGPVKVRFRAEPGTVLQVFTAGGKADFKTTLTADAEGRAEAELPAALTAEPGRVQVMAIAGGQTATSWVEVKNSADFAALSGAASAVKLPRGSRILVLGDSLSDFDRGWNYLDLAESFINLAHPGTVRIFNYGIGGDDISRVSKRFCHAVNPRLPDEVFQKRYRGVLDGPYTHILIFLGQNDTKASSQSGYQTTFVPTPDFEPRWRMLLDALKKQFPDAVLMLVSPIHIDSERQAEISKIVLKTRPNVWQFGIMRHVETYAGVVKKLSAEYQASYLDVYTPSSQADRRRLFKSEDGVHFTSDGQQFMALQLLDFWK